MRRPRSARRFRREAFFRTRAVRQEHPRVGRASSRFLPGRGTACLDHEHNLGGQAAVTRRAGVRATVRMMANARIEAQLDALATLLTFCPPGPDARTKRSTSSSSLICRCSLISSMAPILAARPRDRALRLHVACAGRVNGSSAATRCAGSLRMPLRCRPHRAAGTGRSRWPTADARECPGRRGT